MIGANRERPAKPKAAQPSAMEIEERAATFLERRRYWDWSDADQAELDAWLAESLANRVAYWRLEAALAHTKRLAALNPVGRYDPSSQRRVFMPLSRRRRGMRGHCGVRMGRASKW